jgi:hypothetical protein
MLLTIRDTCSQVSYRSTGFISWVTVVVARMQRMYPLHCQDPGHRNHSDNGFGVRSAGGAEPYTVKPALDDWLVTEVYVQYSIVLYFSCVSVMS